MIAPGISVFKRRTSGAARITLVAKPNENSLTPRIVNRRALHDYHIEAKLECGVVLLGSEVKSIRLGRVQLQESYADIENGRLVLCGCHIDSYEKAAGITHEAKRPRPLLAHRREIKRLLGETRERGTTLIPLSMYFKGGRVKVEIAVARGKKLHDKRDSIRKREMDADLRRAGTQRR
jgi:SsrA-binding protein